MRAKVAERRSRINLTVLEDLHGEQFLKAIDIVLEAVSEHCKRYAELARSMAATESREARRDELLAIAENCDIIAHEPPKTFWQALQLCYFIQLILQIESNGHSVSFGRMDQYLYPYYRRDVELAQSLDREHAIELLHCCWLKLLEVNKIRSGSHSKASAGSPLYQNVTIGGQNLVDGNAQDAVNPLSYAILESCGRLRSTQPNLSVRYHAGMSNDFLDACVQVIRCGFGMPAFNNDEIVIPEFIKLGIEPQDAYDYAAIGCIETAVGGKWGYRCTGMSFINFARVMLATPKAAATPPAVRSSCRRSTPCRKATSTTSSRCWPTGIRRSATTRANLSRLSTSSTPCWKRTCTIFSARRWWMTASSARRALSRAVRNMTGFPGYRSASLTRQQPGGGEEAGVRSGRYWSAGAGKGAG